MSELQEHYWNITHSDGLSWRHFYFFLEFAAATQNLAQKDAIFGSFSFPFLSDFIGNGEKEVLVCPVHALRLYLC